MKRHRVLLGLTLAILTTDHLAHACGHHRRARKCCAVAYATPTAAPVYAAPMATPQYPTAMQPMAVPTMTQTVAAPAPPVAMAPAAMPGAQPRYDYPATPDGQPAYYYTYDESGKLIVQQWMDWVFRGGKEAGMPRPPLPVIGWFQ